MTLRNRYGGSSDMSQLDLVIVGDVVSSDAVMRNGFVGIRGEKIELVGAGTPPHARETRDASGCWVIPGVVDGQVHTGSQANHEGLGIGSRAAAKGGITTMVEMPYDDPEPVATVSQFAQKRDAIETESHVDVALYATIPTSGDLSAISDLVQLGACAFKFSTFEAHPSRFPRISDGDIYRAFLLLAPTGLACGVHNQDQEMAQANIQRLIASGGTGGEA